MPPRVCPKRPAVRSSPCFLPPTRPAPPASTTPNPPRRTPLTATRRRGRRQATGRRTRRTPTSRKLEQIKDLYLTAEAIGEANVDKHFDQLLAQQRELIGEYFKQSSAGRPSRSARRVRRETHRLDAPRARSRAIPGMRAPPGGPAGAAEGARVAADQPRVW